MRKKWHTILLIGILDVAAALLIILGDYIYSYKLPRKLDPLSGQAAIQEPGDPDDWKQKFKEHFTDEVVVTDTGYSSPNIAVSLEKITTGTGEDTVTYFLADIYVADIECIQAGFAQDTYGVGYQEGLEEMSERLQAVVAINGDSYSADAGRDNGAVIRNGVFYREGHSICDNCVLYRDGTMKIIPPDEFDAQKEFDNGAYHVWVFGPSLLDENGKCPTDYNTWDYIKAAHPRTAIGYFEPGHYCMLVADGRQATEQYSRGMYLEELSQVFENLGCKAAFNLDGGHSALMTMNGVLANHPQELYKDFCDCIYIAEPKKEQEQ